MPITFGVFRNDGDDRSDGDFVGGDDLGGGGPMPGAPVSSLLAQALWHTQGDLTNGVLIGSKKEVSPPMEPLDRENIFERWSPDVRAYLYSFELLSGLHFKGDEKDDEPTIGSFTIGEEGKPIAQVTRPEYDKDPNVLGDELAKVMTAIALRPERMAEILTQVQVPYAFFAAVMNLQAGRHRYTYELMLTVFRLSSTVVMQFKNHLRVRRPADRSPLVQPVLPTPGHASFPAGHATQCHFVAAVLKALVAQARKADLAESDLLPDRINGTLATLDPALADLSQQLDKLAERIAYNRVVAGLHYEADNEEGMKLGIALAGYFLPRVRAGRHAALAWLWKRALDEWQNI
jgi:hypothetical protein